MSDKGYYFSYISSSIAHELNKTLRKMFFQVRRYLLERVGRIVPIWRGYLRSSIGKFMRKPISKYPSRNIILSEMEIELHVGSDLPYAEIVNKMPTKWLVHPDEKPPHLRVRKGIRLYDPEAKSHFFEILVKEGRKKMKEIFWNEVKRLHELFKEEPNLNNPIKIASLFNGVNYR
ncbi:MAG: hypothetical protein ACTSUK_03880 [Promethearchaeota archaeon]